MAFLNDHILRTLFRFVPLDNSILPSRRRSEALTQLRIGDQWQLRFICNNWRRVVDTITTSLVLNCVVGAGGGQTGGAGIPTLRTVFYLRRGQTSGSYFNPRHPDQQQQLSEGAIVVGVARGVPAGALFLAEDLRVLSRSSVARSIRRCAVELEYSAVVETLTKLPAIVDDFVRTLQHQKSSLSLRIYSNVAGFTQFHLLEYTAKKGASFTAAHPSIHLEHLTINHAHQELEVRKLEELIVYFVRRNPYLQKLGELNIWVLRGIVKQLSGWCWEWATELSLQMSTDNHREPELSSKPAETVLHRMVSRFPNLKFLRIAHLCFPLNFRFLLQLRQLRQLELDLSDSDRQLCELVVARSNFAIASDSLVALSLHLPTAVDSAESELMELFQLSRSIEELRLDEVSDGLCRSVICLAYSGRFIYLRTLYIRAALVEQQSSDDAQQLLKSVCSLVAAISDCSSLLQELTLGFDAYLPYHVVPGDFQLLRKLPPALKQLKLEWVISPGDLNQNDVLSTIPASSVTAAAQEQTTSSIAMHSDLIYTDWLKQFLSIIIPSSIQQLTCHCYYSNSVQAVALRNTLVTDPLVLAKLGVTPLKIGDEKDSTSGTQIFWLKLQLPKQTDSYRQKRTVEVALFPRMIVE